MMPALPGVVSNVPGGGGSSAAVHSITVNSNQGEHTLRALALSDGWDGIEDIDLTVTYNANQIGTAISTALIQTGTIANSGGNSTIKVIISSGKELRGLGGDGGDGSITTSDAEGQAGGNGQDCFDINTGDTSIPITITNNGTYWSGGGGGGGGGQGNTNIQDGGGGGGGASTGAGGNGSNDGNDGTSTAGGSGANALNANAGDGGNGGNRGAHGIAGTNGTLGVGGARGLSGKKLRKNGHTVTLTGSGTAYGPTVS